MNGRLARWVREEIRLRYPTGLRPTHWVKAGLNDRILVNPRRQAKKAIIIELRSGADSGIERGYARANT